MNRTMNRRKTKIRYVICVANRGYTVSLEKGKIYRVRSDTRVEALHLLRVMDESGEVYLYPEKYFLPISLPQPIVKALRLAA